MIRRQTLALILLNLDALDVLTTNIGLASTRIHESNPAMAYLQTELGSAWWLPKMAMLALTAIGLARVTPTWPLMGTVTLYVLIVGSNLAWINL